MAKRAHVYPQVSLAAVDLADVTTAIVPRGASVRDALALARRRDAGVIAAGAARILRDDLVRADALGLGTLRATTLARSLPSVDENAGEPAVRRLLAGGAPLVVVHGAKGPTGAVSARLAGMTLPDASAAARVGAGLSADARELLVTIGRLAEEHDSRAFLVGGLVRDLWRGAPIVRRDLDVVVEGDGPAVARRLASTLGGTLLEHRRFLTASIDTSAFGRIDVATSRSERYERPGALPRVMPAGIGPDLRRRDFTVNAMAIELSSGEFGLIDPLGARADLARRRLRGLHPLTFVEDPTRIFRAARYAARLGLSFESATRRAQALALRLVPYEALSGQRIAAELQRILAEPHAGAILARLGGVGAFRLLDARLRFTATSRRRLAALPPVLAWAQARALALDPLELAALAIVADQSDAIATAALTRLGLTGGPFVTLDRARSTTDSLASRLLAAGAPSERARLLRDRAPVELAWLWLRGTRVVRETLDWFAGLPPRPGSLSGDDVVALGVPRGPAVARVLAEVRDARLDGKLASRAMEEEHVRQWLAKGG
jgi:tRNA nucleotidyltransferase (CCA-adding enzyme)